MVAAHRLLERNRDLGEPLDVILLEASARPGGIIQTEERDGFLLERGPDSFISEKPEAIDLARRLGLESHLIETNKRHRRSFVVRQGRLLPVPEGFYLLAPARLWPFFRSDIFSWTGKARMMMELLLPRQNANGNTDESLAQFVLRRFGREALERMAQAMVGGIHTADPEQLSLRATFPRFLEMEKQYRSIILAMRQQGGSPTVRESSGTSGGRYSLFLSFDRGMQLLTDKLAERISNFRSHISNSHSTEIPIRLVTSVESLKCERETSANDETPKWEIRTSHKKTIIADAVCLALPAYVGGRLLCNVDPQLASELSGISYASSATINLAYRREDILHPLDGFGFVVPFIEKRSLLACTFSSVKFAGRAPEGYVLLRAFVGGALQPELPALDEAELIQRVCADLRELLGISQPPLFAEVSKWERSMPQYQIGHLERVKRIEDRVASLPGLTLAGNAYSGVGIPDCIRSAENAADELIQTLGAMSNRYLTNR